MKLCLTTACLVAVALGTPDHMPHSVQTDKKPLAKGEKAKAQDEIKKIQPIILHSKMTKDQEEQLAKDVSEVEKMRKALAKIEHAASTQIKAVKEDTKVEPAAAKTEETKVVTTTAASKVAMSTPEPAPKAQAPKINTPKAQEPQEPKVAEAKEVQFKSEQKPKVTKSAKPEAEPVVHEKKVAAPVEPVHHEVVKSAAAEKMKERMTQAEAKGEKMAIDKMSSKSQKHTASTKTAFRRIPVMRPRNFAKTVEQWEAANPVGSKGLLHTGRVHLGRPHVVALPVVKALPWVSTPAAANSTNATAAVVNFGAEKKVNGGAASPEVIAKFTESAQASAERAHKHLEEAKKAFAKTSANADTIHETGKKIEKTAGTIKYLYSTPEPPAPPTTLAPAPKEKSAANSPRSFFLTASVLALGGSILC